MTLSWRALVLRETTFRIGGILTVALGVLFAYALLAAGAGLEYLGGWLAVALCIGFGGFFVYVAHDEARTRREFLATAGAPDPPRREPPPR